MKNQNNTVVFIYNYQVLINSSSHFHIHVKYICTIN